MMYWIFFYSQLLFFSFITRFFFSRRAQANLSKCNIECTSLWCVCLFSNTLALALCICVCVLSLCFFFFRLSLRSISMHVQNLHEVSIPCVSSTKMNFNNFYFYICMYENKKINSRSQEKKTAHFYIYIRHTQTHRSLNQTQIHTNKNDDLREQNDVR